MSPQAARGRRIVIALAILGLTSSAVVILLFLVLRGSDRIPAQFLRFIFTSVIWLCVYKRIPAARWVAVLLYGIGAVTALLSGPGPIFLLAAIHGAIAAILAFSPAVSAHFQHRAG